MLVVEGAKTPRPVVRDALKRLYFARARVVGAVLNKYHPKHAGHGYGYGYGYGYGLVMAKALTNWSTARNPPRR